MGIVDEYGGWVRWMGIVGRYGGGYGGWVWWVGIVDGYGG